MLHVEHSGFPVRLYGGALLTMTRWRQAQSTRKCRARAKWQKRCAVMTPPSFPACTCAWTTRQCRFSGKKERRWRERERARKYNSNTRERVSKFREMSIITEIQRNTNNHSLSATKKRGTPEDCCVTHYL